MSFNLTTDGAGQRRRTSSSEGGIRRGAVLFVQNSAFYAQNPVGSTCQGTTVAKGQFECYDFSGNCNKE